MVENSDKSFDGGDSLKELGAENTQLENLTDLLNSTKIPILVLDKNLRIRQTTPAAETMLSIRPSDIGRRLGAVKVPIVVGDVETLVREVIETAHARELEFQDGERRWFVLRVQPYCTSKNQINGAVLSFIDVNQLGVARVKAEADRKLAESLVEAIETPVVILREDLSVRFANRAFYEKYQVEGREARDQLLVHAGGEAWDAPGLKNALEQMVRERVARLDVEFECPPTAQGRRTVAIDLRPIEAAGERLIFLAIRDITTQKEAESEELGKQQDLKSKMAAGTAELQRHSEMLRTEVLGREQIETALRASEHALLQSRENLRHFSASLMNAQDAERRRVSRELHDDLSQKVAKLQFDIETLTQNVPFEDLQQARERLRNVGAQAAGLSNDLRRVAHQLHPATLDHLGLSVALRSYAEEFSRSATIQIKFTSLFVPQRVPIQLASGLYRIVQEALRNVGKHASNAKVEIVLARVPAGLALYIRDDGEGFDMKAGRAKGGLGLISMEERVRLLDGTFSLETQPGKGVLLSIQCPLPQEDR